MPVYTDPRRYVGVKDGKIIEKIEASDQYKAYNHLSGHLMNITWKQHEKGKLMILHIIDKDDYFLLQLFLNSFYAKSFLKILPNIQLNEEITIITRCRVEDGKKKGSLFVNQFGNSLKWFWNDANRGDLPELVKKYNDQLHKEVWDDSDQLAYLEMYVEQNIIPHLKVRPNPFPAHLAYTGNTGNQIAGNYFGAEQRVGIVGPVSSTERDGANGNIPTAADITEPLDDLPF